MRHRRIWLVVVVAVLALDATLIVILRRDLLRILPGRVTPELERLVAEAIINQQSGSGHRHPDGAVVARVVTTHVTPIEPSSILKVWRCTGGEVLTQEPSVLLKALGRNRAEWPPFTFIFSFDSVKTDSAIVSVVTKYGMGRTERSRGGNEATWKLAKRGNAWAVLAVDTHTFWD